MEEALDLLFDRLLMMMILIPTPKAKPLLSHFLSSIEVRSLTAIFPFILRRYFGLLIKFVICVLASHRFKELYSRLRDTTHSVQKKHTDRNQLCILQQFNCQFF